MRPGRTLRLAIVAALAAGCAFGASPALAAPSQAPELTPAPADGLTRALASGKLTEAEYALERARSLFSPESVPARYGPVEPVGPHDATLVLRDLLARVPELSPSQQREARRITARPTDKVDQFGTTYSVPEAPASPLCTTHICVHYVVSSVDAPSLTDSNTNGYPDWIDSAAAELEVVWAKEVVAYGYRAPKSDVTSANHGPDGKLDVYIADVGSDRLYGYCTSDDPNATSPSYPYGDISAYCVLDDDFAANQFPGVTGLDAFRVTAAHEFFHAVQAAYDFFDDLVLIEGTAVWMEDEVYDDINDNYQYFAASALERPEVPFDLALSGSSSNLSGFQYGAFVFYRYLTETLNGPDLIRRIWELADCFAHGAGPVLARRRERRAPAARSDVSGDVRRLRRGQRLPGEVLRGRRPVPDAAAVAPPHAVDGPSAGQRLCGARPPDELVRRLQARSGRRPHREAADHAPPAAARSRLGGNAVDPGRQRQRDHHSPQRQRFG